MGKILLETFAYYEKQKTVYENQCSHKIYQNMLERRTNTTFCESQLST